MIFMPAKAPVSPVVRFLNKAPPIFRKLPTFASRPDSTEKSSDLKSRSLALHTTGFRALTIGPGAAPILYPPPPSSSPRRGPSSRHHPKNPQSIPCSQNRLHDISSTFRTSSGSPLFPGMVTSTQPLLHNPSGSTVF